MLLGVVVQEAGARGRATVVTVLSCCLLVGLPIPSVTPVLLGGGDTIGLVRDSRFAATSANLEFSPFHFGVFLVCLAGATS